MAWAPIFNQHPRDTYNEFRRLAAFLQTVGVSPLTTKGDLYTFGTGNSRLAVGSNGQVLTADSASANGIKWAAAASGGPRTATKVVAASDSVSTTGADYICDGTADESEINSAITAAGNGGRVLLLEGTYTLSGTEITAGTTGGVLEGQGWGTVLKKGSNGKVVHATGARYRVANLAIDGNATQSVGVHIDQDDIVVEGLRLFAFTSSGPGTAGIWMSGIGNTHGTVRDCWLDGAATDNQHGITMTDGNNYHVVHRNVITGFKYGIRVAADHSLIEDNIVQAVTAAIYLDDGDFNSVVGNQVANATNGVSIDASCDRSLVVGNHLYDTVTTPLSDSGSNTTAQHNVIA